eukprot:SAG31_NODE_6036_length_2198_cov_1.559790_2_plen_180_part_00
MVLPFLSDLKAWIKQARKRGGGVPAVPASLVNAIGVDALEAQIAAKTNVVAGAFDVSALEGSGADGHGTVAPTRAGAFDLSAIEGKSSTDDVPPMRAGAFDLSEIEASGIVGPTVPAKETVVAGAFDVSAIERSAAGSGAASKKGTAPTAPIGAKFSVEASETPTKITVSYICYLAIYV